MACNRDGIGSQPAAGAIGAGDTEVIQMQARAGGQLWDESLKVKSEELPGMEPAVQAIEAAERDDVREPFVVADQEKDYTVCESPEDAIRLARKKGGAAYVYDEQRNPANSPRIPVAIFDEQGRLMMHRQDWTGQIQGVISGN